MELSDIDTIVLWLELISMIDHEVLKFGYWNLILKFVERLVFCYGSACLPFLFLPFTVRIIRGPFPVISEPVCNSALYAPFHFGMTASFAFKPSGV